MTGFIYDLIFFLPFVLSVTSVSRRYINDDIRLFNMVCVSVVVLFVVLIMKHLRLRGRTVLSGVIFAFILSYFVFTPSDAGYPIFKENLWIIILIFIDMICFAAFLIWERYRLIRAIIAFAGAGYLIYSYAFNMYVNKLCTSLIFMFIIFVSIDELQRRSIKEGDTDVKKHTVGVMPFVLFVFIVIMFISIPSKPYDWKIVKKISEFAKSQYIRISENFISGNEWDKDTPIIGFSDRAAPGGDLERSERKVMELKMTSERDRCIYLSGKTFDRFDGRSWDKKDKNTVDERFLDSIETMSAILDNGGERPVTDYLKKTSLTTEYKDMHTLCMFIPPKVISVRGEADEKKISGSDYSFTDKKNARFPYVSVFYRVNRDSDAFAYLASESHEVTKESFDAALRECGVLTSLTFEDYQKYHEDIYKTYLPETEISDKAEAYIEDHLNKADSDYEKLCAIEEMLSAYKYSEKPGRLPLSVRDEAGFLDYFLFDMKEGYCSYFASAFVIIARSEGIPARYVQGYRVPLGKESVNKVSSNCAHAWPEAYLDGIGWVSFEPTPGMHVETSWELSGTAKAGEAESVKAKKAKEEDINEEDLGDELKESVKGTFNIYQILIPVLSGVVLSLLIFAIDRLIRFVRYSRMDDLKKAEYDCKRKMEMLKRKRLGKKREETLMEYSERLRYEAPDEDISFIETYENILYGQR
ncbi:MAG TPA: hypothetical protein DCG85_06215 [Lachnospiraceae bacterium]|nr:hypothetical protein [Lachnospiraceae bacterium]